MIKRLISIGSLAAALTAPLLVTSPAQAAETQSGARTGCTLVLINGGYGAYNTCEYEAVIANGNATYVAVLGQATLTVNCTVGHMSATVGQGSSSYYQVGICEASLYNSHEVPVTAVAEVGN